MQPFYTYSWKEIAKEIRFAYVNLVKAKEQDRIGQNFNIMLSEYNWELAVVDFWMRASAMPCSANVLLINIFIYFNRMYRFLNIKQRGERH